MTAATAGAAIEVSALSKAFDGARPTDVLGGVELSAPAGTVTLIVGPPGCGRSTLVRSLTGVYRPDAGTLTYQLGGRRIDLAQEDPRGVAWMRQRHIASFDGALAAAPSLPVGAAVAAAARSTRSAVAAALDRFRIADLAAEAIGRIRPADRLTVALVTALLSQRPFVVLDDPERSADPAPLTSWLRRAADAGAVVVVTGATDSPIRSIANAVGALQGGEITWQKQ